MWSTSSSGVGFNSREECVGGGYTPCRSAQKEGAEAQAAGWSGAAGTSAGEGRQPAAAEHDGADGEVVVTDDQVRGEAGAQDAGRGGARRGDGIGDGQACRHGAADDVGHGGGGAGDGAWPAVVIGQP